MADRPIDRYERRKASLKSERDSFIPHWREISEHVRPRSARFLVTDRNRGDRRNSKIVDPTSIFASRTLSSGMMAGITSPARPWFNLLTPDPDLNRYQPVKVWLDDVRNRLAAMFLKSNLYTTLPGTYADLGDFGVNAFAILPDDQDVMRCYPAPIGSYMLGLSHRLSVDTFYREFQMTAGQMVGQFGKDKVSQGVRSAFGNNKDAWFDVVHVVEPNEEHDPERAHSKFKAFKSIYYEPGGNGEFLSEKGFDTFPIVAPRWDVVGEDIYGSNCPGMDALSSIKGLQIERKRKTEGIDKLMRPPMTAPSSLRNGVASQLPGGLTFVDVSAGQQGFQPAYQVPDGFLQPLTADIQEVQAEIKRAYYEDLFLLISNIERTGVTAEEIASKKEEKLLMLGPAYLRLNDEHLTPTVDRGFDLGMQAGMFPPPPPELQGGMDLTVEFTSVMAQAMKLAGIGAIERAFRFIGSLQSVDQTAMDNMDTDATVEEVFDILGTPPRMRRDPKVRDQIRQQRQQQQQMQNALAMAQQGAQTAQTMADTQVTEPSVLSQMVNQMQGA